MVSEKLKRLLAFMLLLGLMGGCFFQTYDCPFWQAGICCPSCGSTRAVLQMVHGDPIAAFKANPFWLYWLAVYGCCVGSVLVYCIGLAKTSGTWGKKMLDKIPVTVHFAFWAGSWMVNLFIYGVNEQGWIFQMARYFRHAIN